jgi:diacylglycerol kinase family enzyme
LRIPLDPRRAFDVAFNGRECRIDAGELDSRLFFNVAGIGLDARVAHRFAANGLRQRGFRRYAAITAQELFTYKADYHTIVTDGRSLRVRTLLIAIANARQYGNGALIAPAARVDDGKLDVVIVDDRSAWAVIRHAPKLFRGRLADVPGVTMSTATRVDITANEPLIYHVDGEPCAGGSTVSARIRPAALRVRVSSLCA